MIDKDGQRTGIKGVERAGGDQRRAAKRDPEWTRGLKRLYDSVLEEPMPQNFRDLLSKLDDDTPEK